MDGNQPLTGQSIDGYDGFPNDYRSWKLDPKFHVGLRVPNSTVFEYSSK